MQFSLSSLDLHYLCREFQVLVGMRLDKAYQHAEERRDLLLQFHGGGKRLLRLLLPNAVYLAEQKPRYGKLPGHFAVFLRKHIGNARCTSVAQRGFDRILELGFENKNGTFTLVVELVPPGNMLLLNSDGKIINLLEPKRLGSRTLRGGAHYEAPPERCNTREASLDELRESLLTMRTDLVRTLASTLGLGGAYAEECCARLGIEKSKERLSHDELAAAARAVQELFHHPIDARANDDESVPFPFLTKELPQQHPSFSHAIEHVVTLHEDREEVAEQTARVTTQRSKTEKVIEQQRAALAGLERSAAENQRKGELLYEHYQEVGQLLTTIQELRREHEWPAIKERLKGRATIDESRGRVTVELD